MLHRPMIVLASALLLVGSIHAQSIPSLGLPKANDDGGVPGLSFAAAGDAGASEGKAPELVVKAFVMATNPTFTGMESDNTMKLMFKSWIQSFKKKYTSYSAYYTALTNFKANLKRCAKINEDANRPFWCDLNTRFADQSFEQFASQWLMKENPLKFALNKKPVPAPLVSAVTARTKTRDWRTTGKLTPVKDQAGCGSCWAFAAATTIESAYLISKGKTYNQTQIDVSEQQIVSCANSRYGYGSNGCDGGGSDAAISYVAAVNTMSEARYPYTSGRASSTGNCNFNLINSLKPGQYIKLAGGANYIARNSQTALMAAVDKQPVVIYFAVEASFWQYSSGVYTPSGCNTQVNHAMVVVGYKWTGSSSTSYWIIRNSWGPSWGEKGYMRVRMTGSGSGACLMYTYPIAPPMSFAASM